VSASADSSSSESSRVQGVSAAFSCAPTSSALSWGVLVGLVASLLLVVWLLRCWLHPPQTLACLAQPRFRVGERDPHIALAAGTKGRARR